MIESQLHYIVEALQTMHRRRWSLIDVHPEAQARYNREIQRRASNAIWSVGGCKS